MTINLVIIASLGIVIGILINIFMRIKAVSAWVNTLVNDTFKREGKWSVTRLTMGTAWFACLYSYFYDLTKNGFNLEAFLILVGVALGAKVTDAYSKKLNPETPPKQEG